MCCRPPPTATPCSTWAGGIWTRSPHLASCPISPGSPCTTATRSTTTRRGPSWAGTKPAQRICCGISPTPAEAYPAAVWPEQAQRALRGLIHAFNSARDTGQPAIPATIRDPLITSFRHAIRVGLSEVRPAPGPRHRTAQPPGRDLLEFCRDRETDVLRFCFDPRVWPTNNISERDLRPKIGRASCRERV